MKSNHQHEMNSGLSSLYQALDVILKGLVDKEKEQEMLHLAKSKVEELIKLWEEIKEEQR